MPSSVLAIGGLGLDAYRTRVANFLTAEDGRVRLVEVRLFNSAGYTVGRNEWRPQEDVDLDGMAEQIARYIIRHESADATILVRRDGSGRVQGADRSH
jgi:hypothetical protein